MLIIIGIFILGLFFGSFSSVLITRFSGEYSRKTIKSVLIGRSECPQCKKKLTAKNLIPLVSWLCQKGKCDECGKKIPNFYPRIEICSGIVFILTYLFFPHGGEILDLIFWLFINWSLMILIVSDMRYYELNIPIYSVLLVGTLLYLAYPVLDYGFLGLKTVGIASVFGIVFFLAYLGIYYFAKRYAKVRKIGREGEGFGFGDVLFSFFVGLIFSTIHGFSLFHVSLLQDIILLILIYTIISCLLGIVYYFISLLILPKQKPLIPFLPAMIIALRIVILYPEVITLFIQL